MAEFYRNLKETAIRPAPDFNRLLKVLRKEGKSDFVPFYELFVNHPVMETILARKLPDRVSTIEFYYRAGYDYVPVWPTLPPIKAGSLVDTRQGYPITDRKTFQKYPWPKVSDITYPEFNSVIPALPRGMKIIGQTGWIFEMAQTLCGYDGLCLLLADDRKTVSEIFERLGVLYEALYEGMARIKEVGAVVISDDLGYKTQTMLSPTDLREFVLPWHKRLAEIIHKYDKPCILHSCWNLAAIMEDLISRVRIDAKHSYEDAILPAAEAKRLYGDRIAILG